MNALDVERELKPRFLTAAEVLALPAENGQWIWDKACRAGQLSLLVGKPRLGKSTLAANLCLAIARGEAFLGRATLQTATAYISLDATLHETKEIFEDFGLTAADPVFFYAEAMPGNPIQFLMEHITKLGVKFAVVDTLQLFLRFQDGNAYSEVNNRMAPLLSAARKHGCHICLLHHAKKGEGDDLDAAIGSTAIKGNCSSALYLKKLPSSEKRVLTSDFRRGENFRGVAIDFKAGGWLEAEGSAEEAEIKIAKPRVIQILEGGEGERSEKEISEQLAMRQWIVGQAIRQLHQDGKIERTGKGKKGSPYRYSFLAGSLSSPKEGGEGETIPGEESKKRSQVVENAISNSSPRMSGEEREKNGEALFSNGSGRSILETTYGRLTGSVLEIFPGATVVQERARN